MDLPAGQILVGLVGAGILVVGGALIYKGVSDRFLKDIDGKRARVAPPARRTPGSGGSATPPRVRHSAVVGILFGYAAITHEANESGGLDQALTEVLDQPFGPVLLTAMGVGIVCFGVFCFAWARHIDR